MILVIWLHPLSLLLPVTPTPFSGLAGITSSLVSSKGDSYHFFISLVKDVQICKALILLVQQFLTLVQAIQVKKKKNLLDFLSCFPEVSFF